jgi:hypothetical protein
LRLQVTSCLLLWIYLAKIPSISTAPEARLIITKRILLARSNGGSIILPTDNVGQEHEQTKGFLNFLDLEKAYSQDRKQKRDSFASDIDTVQEHPEVWLGRPAINRLEKSKCPEAHKH